MGLLCNMCIVNVSEIHPRAVGYLTKGLKLFSPSVPFSHISGIYIWSITWHDFSITGTQICSSINRHSNSDIWDLNYTFSVFSL